MPRPLDTSELGPIRFTPTRYSQARELYADAIRAQGPAWKNTADSILTGGFGNVWTAAALTAIDRALRTEPETD